MSVAQMIFHVGLKGAMAKIDAKVSREPRFTRIKCPVMMSMFTGVTGSSLLARMETTGVHGTETSAASVSYHDDVELRVDDPSLVCLTWLPADVVVGAAC